MIPSTQAQIYVRGTHNSQHTIDNRLDSPQKVAQVLNPLNLTMSNSSSPSSSPFGRRVSTLCNDTVSVGEHESFGLGKSMENSPTPEELAISRKPELTFSIERILNWTSKDSRIPSFKQDINHHDRHFVDDDEEDETIDVDDTGTTDHLTDNKYGYDFSVDEPKYQWLQCTRYHPPKLQRSKKKDGTKKRKLGRNPRVPFTQHQVVVLEEKFRRTHYLSSMDVAELSTVLSLTETRVKIWFQNRRARERRDKETTQRNQSTMAQKAFQPLAIPSVAWPMAGSMMLANYAQYDNALNFRSGYLSSASGIYASRDSAETVKDESDSSPQAVDKNKTPTHSD